MAIKPLCNYRLGNVVCGRPAIYRIDRGRWGVLLLCRVHLNDPAIYADVKQHAWPHGVIYQDR